MLYTEFLKTTVMLMAAEATALAAIAILSAMSGQNDIVLIETLGFLVLGGIAGVLFGRRPKTTTAIATLLAEAKSETALPPIKPGSILINRLWPLGVYALVFAGASFIYPQPAALGAALLIFAALAWRKQGAAVTAIEERDGARFYVTQTSPFRGIELVRASGLRRVTSLNGS